MQVVRLLIVFFFAIAFCDNKHRAAKVIDVLLHDTTTKDSLFGNVVSKQLDLYFTNNVPWGLNSLITLHMYLSGVHHMAVLSNQPDYNKDAGRVDTVKIKILFAAMLPPGLESILQQLCVSFSKNILKEEQGDHVGIMVNTYKYVQHKEMFEFDFLKPAVLNHSKPGKDIYELIKRFQKLYPRERLEQVFFVQYAQHQV